MKTEFQQIREHVLGLSSRPAAKHPKKPKDILKKNWFPRAIQLCKNRMILGSFRYGYFRDWDQPKFNRIESIDRRWADFKQSKNLEHLLDIINLCGIEFEKPNTVGVYFSPSDDGIHTTI